MDKILITGAGGFIGKSLAYKLKKLDVEVEIIDFPKKITKQLKNDFKCYGYDLSNKLWMDKLPKDYDYIYHIAAQSGGMPSLKNPQIDCKWNCLATVNIVDFCRNIKPKKVIFTSSMAVYGNNTKVTEKTNPHPISFYGTSKLCGEYYIKLLSEHHKIPYTIFRLFATYGNGQDLSNKMQGIVSIYIKLMQESNKIEITGKKDRIRQLVHINDVLDALILGLGYQTDNEIYNVCYEENVTPEMIINEINKWINKKIEIIELNGYNGDQTHITGKNKKLRKIGWKPKYNLSMGIKEFMVGLGYERI